MAGKMAGNMVFETNRHHSLRSVLCLLTETI
jgi:hypothetical protein